MAHDPDVRLGDRTHPGEHPPGALELDDVGAALLDHSDRAGNGLLVGHLVGAERQIADHERTRRRPGHRPGQEDHLVERHRQGRRVAEHDHRCRVADEDHLDARLVGDASGGSVVGGDHHDPVADAVFIWASSGSGSLPGAGVEAAGVRGRVLMTLLSDRTLSIRRVRPTRAATASVGPVEVGDRRRSRARARRRRAPSRAWAGSPVARARGIASACSRSAAVRAALREESARPSSSRTVSTTLISTLEVQVAHELLQHGDLLRVLAPEPGRSAGERC